MPHLEKARKAGVMHYMKRLENLDIAYLPEIACPFEPGDERDAWMSGHNDAPAALEAAHAERAAHAEGGVHHTRHVGDDANASASADGEVTAGEES